MEVVPVDDLKGFFVEVILPIGGIGLAVLGPLVALALWADSASCHSQWRKSGFQTSWGPIQGCLISKDGRTWIPADNYRALSASVPTEKNSA